MPVFSWTSVMASSSAPNKLTNVQILAITTLVYTVETWFCLLQIMDVFLYLHSWNKKYYSWIIQEQLRDLKLLKKKILEFYKV